LLTNVPLLPAVLVSTVYLALAACGSEPQSSAPPAKKASVAPGPATAEAVKVSAGMQIDLASGLIIDEGWNLVLGHCSACHSTRLVTQNRADRDTWERMIRWMQETQGLWPLDPATENTILDYLARNYAPTDSARRAPLAARLMPPNPYR